MGVNSKGTNKESAIRYVYILQALHRRPLTITDLLEELDRLELKQVSRRTIQRDMLALEGRFGVYRDEDDPELWCLDKTDFEKVFELEDAVALALLVAEKQLSHTTPSHILDPLESLFFRAKAQLKSRKTIAANWIKRVKVAPASHHVKPPILKRSIYEVLMDTALRQQVLKIDYHRHQGDAPHALVVTALSIFYRGSVPYLICRDHSKGRIRQLPFSRISSAQESIVEEPRIEDFELDTYEDSGALAFRYGGPFLLELEIFNSVRREVEDTPLGLKQKITPIEGRPYVFQMQVEVPYTLNLIQWLLARSPYLKVKGPADFRDKFYEELRRALANGENEHVDVPKQRNFG